jgi:hypothetical protein
MVYEGADGLACFAAIARFAAFDHRYAGDHDRLSTV